MSKQRAKGTAAETAVVKFLHAMGFTKADRSPLRGTKDMGDITGIKNFVIEVKNQKKYNIPAWLRELEVEKQNAQKIHGVLVVKPVGVGLNRQGEWWAVMPLSDLATILQELDK